MNTTRAVSLSEHRAGLQLRETAIVLALAVVLPVLVHLAPALGGVPWGARLLPLFIAPFLGVVFFRLHVGLVPALLAPGLNALVTGLPALPLVGILTLELTVFTLMAYGVLRRWPGCWVAAPLAYILTKGVSGLLVVVLPLFAPLQPAGAFVASSLTHAVPGLLLLLLINVLVLRWSPRREG